MPRAATRTLGVLPALGSSLADFRRHGQLDRLLSYYFPAYLEGFDRIRFFSYEPERLDEFTDDPTLRARIEVVAPQRRLPRRLAAASLAAGGRGRLLRACAIARVLQAPGALPAAFTRTPYVCTYGYSYPRFTGVVAPGAVAGAALAGKRAVMRAGLSLLLRRAEATIVTTTAGEVEALGLGARKVVYVPNGVDLDLFGAEPSGGDFDVLFVGRLTEQKDVPTLLRACARIQGVRLGIVGDGPLRPGLEAQARDLGLSARFFGNIDGPAVATVLAGSRVFALPSRYEGHPKALIEALAAGVACVGSDIDGIRELGAAGAVELFPPGDEEALAGAIRRVLSDDQRRERLAYAGRSLASRQFDLRQLIRIETQLLVELAI